MKMQLRSLSFIFNNAMAATTVSGNFEWKCIDGDGLSSTWRSGLVASREPGALFSIEEAKEEIEMECNSAEQKEACRMWLQSTRQCAM